jgi:hypothetical protein
MPGTPARPRGAVLAGSGVFAIIVTGAGLAALIGAATPALAVSSALAAGGARGVPGAQAAPGAWGAGGARAVPGAQAAPGAWGAGGARGVPGVRGAGGAWGVAGELAAPVPMTVSPSIAMPALPVTFTIACGPRVKSATLFGKTVNLNGPVAMRSTGGGTFAVTVNLPTGMAPGVYQALAGCESGDFGTVDLTVNALPAPSPSRSPSPSTSQSPSPSPSPSLSPSPQPPQPSPTWQPPPPPPTAAPVTGDGTTSIPGGIAASAVVGLGLLGVGGVTGLAALRRFRSRR